MIHINRLYEQFNSEYNTSQHGFYRPVTDFVPALHAVSLELFNKLAGAAPRSQKIVDWLSPFIKTLNVAVLSKPSYDYLAKPKGYEFYASSRVLVENNKSCGQPECDFQNREGDCVPFEDLAADFFVSESEYEEHAVTMVPVNKWAAVTRHITKRPTMQRPYIRTSEEGFIVAPKGLGLIVLDFYRKPVAPVFNYTTVNTPPDVYLQFVETGSVHLEWSETLVPVFLYQLGKHYGLSVQDQLILQVTQLDKIFM